MPIADYKFIQRVWVENKMNTLQDLLVWYQKLDVRPFQEALKTQCDFYASELSLDMLKDAVTIPGLTLRYLFNTLPHHVYFSLVSEQDKDFFQSLHSQIVGGPSIVFKRHIEKGGTRIRGADGKLTQKVVGYDANALYLWALAQDMPTEGYARYQRDQDGLFHLKKASRKEQDCREWLEWVAHEQGINIQHRYHGKQKMLGPKGHRVFLDGFDPVSQTAYEYQGCYWHGCDCDLTRNNHAINSTMGKSFDQLNTETKDKIRFLRDELKLNVVEIRECEWFAKKASPDVAAFLQTLPPKPSVISGRGPYSQEKLLEAISSDNKADQLFGFVRCDLKVPEHLKDHFSEMTPIFKNVDIEFKHIGPFMQQFAKEQKLLNQPRRSLIGSYEGKDIWLATPLLRWYLKHGLVVEKIYEVVQYTPQKCFEPFAEKVSDNRLEGMLQHKDILAQTFKLLGNSAYGKTLENKAKHTKVLYTDAKEFESCVCDPLFRKSTPLDENESLFEVEMLVDKIIWDLPLQIGIFVYQYAKLRMLEFYYDFIDKFIDRRDFELAEMDTDSLYMGISGDCLEDLIKPDKREAFYHEFSNYLQVESCLDHRQEFVDTRVQGKEWQPTQCCKDVNTKSRFTPGLFKVEHTGDVITALCSKTYITYTKQPDNTEGDVKISCKGLNKNTNNLTGEIYRNVIENKEAAGGVNRGFKVRADGVFQYEQHRKALSFLYIKRRVLADGVSTEPLDI